MADEEDTAATSLKNTFFKFAMISLSSLTSNLTLNPALMRERERERAVARIPDEHRERERAAAQIPNEQREKDRCVILGRG
jgi:hypothetical protein